MLKKNKPFLTLDFIQNTLSYFFSFKGAEKLFK